MLSGRARAQTAGQPAQQGAQPHGRSLLLPPTPGPRVPRPTGLQGAFLVWGAAPTAPVLTGSETCPLRPRARPACSGRAPGSGPPHRLRAGCRPDPRPPPRRPSPALPWVSSREAGDLGSSPVSSVGVAFCWWHCQRSQIPASRAHPSDGRPSGPRPRASEDWGTGPLWPQQGQRPRGQQCPRSLPGPRPAGPPGALLLGLRQRERAHPSPRGLRAAPLPGLGAVVRRRPRGCPLRDEGGCVSAGCERGCRSLVRRAPLGSQHVLASGESWGDPGWPGGLREACRGAALQRRVSGPPEEDGHRPLLVSGEFHRWFWCLFPW